MTEIGSVLGGRYRLLELLGQGGMATIYRARDAQLDRDVAVKLLRPEFGQDPDFLARFRDEARAAASLSHPNVVGVFDFGEDASGPYIVMELVDGQDLASILRENGPLPPRQAARVTAEVAKALHAAHVRGLIHRDVKPSNILVGRDGRIRVADFGIARAVSEAQVTLPGTTMGSVHYFSPEQARGETATAPSDIYALGIVLFEALTGARPFSGDGASAIALARLTAPAPKPSSLRAGVPTALDAIVARAMALDPSARYATAAAMAAALEGWLSDTAAAAAAGAAAAGAAGAAGSGDTSGAAGAAAAGAAAGATVAAATAKPNPVPYPPEAYALSVPTPPPVVSTRGAPPPPPVAEDEPPEDEGSGPWAWVAGILGLLILAIVGFLVFQMLTGGRGEEASPSPSVAPSASVEQVAVPALTDLAFTDAETAAESLGLTVVRTGTEERDDVEPDTVLSQDPAEGTLVPAGTEIGVVVARGRTAVPVPDIRNVPEAQALQVIVADGLTVGTRTTAFDPAIAAGNVISQQPGAGIIVAPGTPVDYVVSDGPEPTPTPTVAPTPTPTVAPTATPKPTPTPTPPPVNVGVYTCKTVEVATTEVDGDGLGSTVVSDPAGTDPVPQDWIVVTQDPTPGTKVPAGSSVTLTAMDPADVTTCP